MSHILYMFYVSMAGSVDRFNTIELAVTVEPVNREPHRFDDRSVPNNYAIIIQFARLFFQCLLPLSPSAVKRSQMSWAAAVARKLAGTSQSSAPPALTGGLLYR